MKRTNTRLILLLLIGIWNISCNNRSNIGAPQIKLFRKNIKHVIIIYQENWSFDGLYGMYPDRRVHNLINDTYNRQVDRKGAVIDSLPLPVLQENMIDYRFIGLNKKFPHARPYDLSTFIPPNVQTITGDLVHRFYTEQKQIDSGKMDMFIAWSDNPGLTLSYYSDTALPEERIAKKYTLCDNFFHSAFGGSFLNHIWFIAAASPHWKDASRSLICDTNSDEEKKYDNVVTADGYAVNTIQSVNHPHKQKTADSLLLPCLDMETIGDRLNDKSISWAWYAGGWNNALEGNPDGSFQFHHQPFVYFEKYKDGSENKKIHLRDEKDFFSELTTCKLPEVVFIKPLGINNEHPGYAILKQGQAHVDSIVQEILQSRYADSSIIIITYDENGGRFDHVAPPKIDRWGPGTRVPTIIISKYAKRDYIDHTQYETVSILKLIETLYDLKPLSKRDSAANNMMNALDFNQ